MKPNFIGFPAPPARWLRGLSVVGVALALLAEVGRGDIFYDNPGDSATNNLFRIGNGVEVGNEVMLNAQAPITLTNFSFEYYGLNFTGVEQLRLRFYRQDPITLSPGTLIYDSGWGGIAGTGTTPPPVPPSCTFPCGSLPWSPGGVLPSASSATNLSNGGVLCFTDFSTGAELPLTEKLPIDFTWTVMFQGLQSGVLAGLVTCEPIQPGPFLTKIFYYSVQKDWEEASVGKNLNNGYWQWKRFPYSDPYWGWVICQLADFHGVGFPTHFRARIEGEMPATFLAPTLDEQGLALRLVGKPGCQYRIESSPDLQHWSELQTGTATNGVMTATVPAAGDCRFFRALIIE